MNFHKLSADFALVMRVIGFYRSAATIFSHMHSLKKRPKKIRSIELQSQNFT